VLDAVDRELAPYGGFHAVSRDRQLSNYVLDNELAQLESLALTIPIVFLAVAAFLVNVVISRLVYLERTQIAILKAVGRRSGEISLHYLGLVALIVAIGAGLGIAFGMWLGGWMTDLYADFFRLPGGDYRLSFSVTAMTVAISLAAAVAGALGAVRRVVRLPAAEAMRPPAPPSYRRGSLGGFGWLLGPSAMMILREIARRPWRFLLSTAAIAMGVGIFIVGRFSWDSFDRLMVEDFPREHREDLIVTFARPLPERALREVAHLPGVELAEGMRTVPVRFRSGSRWRDSAITGLPHPSELRRLLHARERMITPPPEGVLVTDKLAEILGVGVGDRLDVEVFEGAWPKRSLTVTGLIDEPFGLQAYARGDWLASFLREEPRVNAVLLRVDPDRMDDVYARLKDLPAVSGATSTRGIIERYRAQTGESVLVMTLVLTLSAAAIAIGVVYNNARIALSLRSRDLASLRVLGFTRKEISTILLGELSAQVVLGIPLGLVFGWAWARLYAAGIDPEVLRFPFYISNGTYAAAAAIAMVSGLVSALLVRRRLDDLDLVAVLKATE
jgi:putative ABC transport system permease protein